MAQYKFDEGNSDYEPTDSDEDYDENEKILLNKVRSRQFKDSDSEGEVFDVGSNSDEEDADDDQSDLAASDVEGQDDDDKLPDARAWGKKKSKFYSTDYVDQDYGGFQGKDAHLAELEEEEARNLQQQLAQQLDDDDFQLDIPTNKKIEEEEKKLSEEIIKTDVSKLSKRQRLQILQKESPEFFGLVEDYEAKMIIVRDFLSPVLDLYKKGKLPHSSAVEFVICYHQLIMNYCTNIYMYLLIKASRLNVQNHPIIKRLYQYRKLLSEMSPNYEKQIKPQIETLLAEKDDSEKPKQTLKILSKLTDHPDKGEAEMKKKKNKKRRAPIENGEPKKKVKFDDKITEYDNSAPEKDEDDKTEETPESEVGKRAITYQIAKNKGLTPHRKKEQRNPRVKHRNKFRKAKIRRRGAIREARTEMTRYGGEISGIKTSVTKSIKLKS